MGCQAVNDKIAGFYAPQGKGAVGKGIGLFAIRALVTFGASVGAYYTANALGLNRQKSMLVAIGVGGGLTALSEGVVRPIAIYKRQVEANRTGASSGQSTEQLQTELKAARKNIEDCQQTIENLQAELDERPADAPGEGDTTALQAELERRTEALRALQSTNRALQARLDTANEALAQEASEGASAEVRKKLGEATATIRDLEAQQLELRARVETATELLKRKDEQLSQIQDRLTSPQEEGAGDDTDLRLELADAKKQEASLKAELAATKAALLQKEEEATRLDDEHEKTMRALEKLEKAKADAEVIMEEAKRDHAKYEEAVKQAQAATDYMKMMGGKAEKLDELFKQSENFKKQMEQLQAENDALRKKLASGAASSV